MPLNETEIFKENTMNIEHSGGDGWTILHGDPLKIIRKYNGLVTGLTQNIEVRPDRALCKAV